MKYKLIFILFCILLFNGCSVFVSNILNDSYLYDGEYAFVMYDTWGEKILTEGSFTFYSQRDSTITGSYIIQKDNGSFLRSDGKVYGKIDHEKGKAEFSIGTESVFDAKIIISKTMDLIDGKWEINARSGRFVAFQKSKTL